MRVVIYTDSVEKDVTSWVNSVSLTRSILEPYESARLDLSIPYHQDILPTFLETGVIDLDSWIVIYKHLEGDSRERALFLGCLTGVTGGFYAVTGGDFEGGIRARRVSLQCESWLKHPRSGEIYLSGKTTTYKGHILDIEQFGERFRKLGALAFKDRNIGAALKGFWEELGAPYRLPDTLGGRNLGETVSIAYDKASSEEHTPQRLEPHRSVFGLALNTVSAAIAGGGATAWGIIRSTFGAETNMIELFTSLEPSNGESKLEKKLGVRPVLIYRMKPFVFGEYSQTLSDSALRRIDTEAGASQIASVLSISHIISVDISLSDSDRVNAVYLNTPLTPSRGVELFGLAGDPVFNEDDIDRQGLRLFKGNWPFFPQGKRRKTEIEGYREEIQNLIDLAAAITEEDHRFLNGTIQLKGRPLLQAGIWAKIDLTPLKKRSLVFYVESCTFSADVREDGVLMERSVLEYTRGFYL